MSNVPTLRALIEEDRLDELAPDEIEGLVDDAVGAIRSAPKLAAHYAAAWERDAEAVDAGTLAIPMADGTTKKFAPADAITFRRRAELTADRELAMSFLRGLPEPHRSRALQRADEERRPYPISVEVPEFDAEIPFTDGTKWYRAWSCDNCGEAHDVGDGIPVVVIGWRPGYSLLEDPLRYCVGCIAIAAQVGAPAGA